MVYPKNWRLEDRFSTGKTLKSLDWVWYSYTWFRGFMLSIGCDRKIVYFGYDFRTSLELCEFIHRLRTTEFWIWKSDIMHELSEMSFWMVLHYLSLCLSLIVFWSRMWSGTMNTLDVQFVQHRDAEWMRCHVERGYGNLPPCGRTLWVRVKRHVIHHLCVQLCVQKITARVHCDMDGREHSTCCRRNLYHSVLFVFGLIRLWHPGMSLISVDLTVVYWSVLHFILDSAWVWYSLLLELKIPTLVWHCDLVLCIWH